MSCLNGFATGPGAGLTIDDTTLKASRDSTQWSAQRVRNHGDGGPPLHVHDHEHESFYVLDGELSVVCGDDRFSVPPSSFVFMPRGRAHRFLSTNGSARVKSITVPGGIEGYFRELHAAHETERGAVQAQYAFTPWASRDKPVETCDASVGSRERR
jgi:mannose-6-phosphate isomerase-like protein (cupin superfamily)